MRESCSAFDGIFDEIVDNAGGDSEYLTFANLWNNANYPRFIEEFVPILKNKKVIFICNEASKFDELPFKVVKHFPIGSNAMINNYGIIEDIKNYINSNNIEDHVFLCSAASLSNLIIHQLYEMNNKNTYIDVGSTLNPLMGLSGYTGTRTYLNQYWNDETDKSQLQIIDHWT